jgi:hypothetical protein
MTSLNFIDTFAADYKLAADYELAVDYEPAWEDGIDLDPTTVDEAKALVAQITDRDRQWQSYLALLALAGFRQWLPTQAPEIPSDLRHATLLLPTASDAPAAIHQIQLNAFRVVLLAVDAQSPNQIVELPAAIVEAPAQIAHYYVTVLVDTEYDCIRLHSFLRYDQLTAYRQSHNLQPDAGVYSLPIHLFDCDLHHLLLLAAELNPAQLRLPNPTTPEVQRQPIQQLLVQPVLNAASWFQQQVNQAIDLLAWTLVPVQPLTNGLRSSMMLSPMRTNGMPMPPAQGENLTHILREVARRGIAVPSDMRAAYQDITLQSGAYEVMLRLSIALWPLPDSPDSPEPQWSLLTILQPLAPDTFSADLHFWIRDDTQVLVEKPGNPSIRYEISQVIGTYPESFTIGFQDAFGDQLILPPITFQPS